MKIIDPGHKYIPDSLDGNFIQEITFVKRYGDKYPGNTNCYPGTTIQELCRIGIDRLTYVDAQKPSEETQQSKQYFRTIIFKLEKRAARLHNRQINPRLVGIEFEKCCKKCGHIQHQCT